MSIKQDKEQHIVGGALICAAVIMALSLVFHPNSPAEVIFLAIPGYIAAAAAGDVKEMLDSQDPERHTEDPMDAGATRIGGAIITLGMFILCVAAELMSAP